MTGNEASKITDRSLLSLPIVVSVAVASGAGAAWAASVTQRLSDIEDAIVDSTADRWTSTDERAYSEAVQAAWDEWASKFEEETGLNVPQMEFPHPISLQEQRVRYRGGR